MEYFFFLISSSMILIAPAKNGFVNPFTSTAIHFPSVRFRYRALLFGIYPYF